MSLTVLLVGKGAREHCLAWRLTQSPCVKHVYVCPGNGGTDRLPKASNFRLVEANDYIGLAVFAQILGVGLVLAGPDDAVVDGIEGHFRGSKFP
jgi:phosphoribosylamine-glycine ligase